MVHLEDCSKLILIPCPNANGHHIADEADDIMSKMVKNERYCVHSPFSTQYHPFLAEIGDIVTESSAILCPNENGHNIAASGSKMSLGLHSHFQ